MQFSDPAVVTIEKSQQVFGKIALVFCRQCSHDAKVNRNILAFRTDENVTRVHIGMKEVVPEYLGEEDFHTAFAKQLHTDALAFKFIHFANVGAVDAFDDHDILTTQVPENLGYIKLF